MAIAHAACLCVFPALQARKERTELVKQFLIALRRKQRADRQLEWPSEEMATDAREQQGAEGGDSQSHEGMNGSR